MMNGVTWQTGPLFQYQDIAEGLVPPFSGVAGGTAPNHELTLRGAQIQYMAHAEPLAVPTFIPPADLPDQWVPIMGQGMPQYQMRRRLGAAEGAFVLPIVVPQISVALFSWQPIKGRIPGLRPPFLQEESQVAETWIATTIQATPGTATWGAQYPSYQLRRAPVPNIGPSFTWTPITITPPPPPVQHLKVDLRRREQLGVRRLIR